MKKHIEVINLVESDAVTNGIFSFFIPGLGQAIEGYKLRGAIFFIIQSSYLGYSSISI